MNIKILDSWLKDYLKTDATAETIAEKLSLTSVSVDRVEKYGNDFIYDIEVTTNRPDLYSVLGLAREAAAILPQFGIKASFIEPKFDKSLGNKNIEVKIINDPKLVNRIIAVSMDVKISQSEQKIKERLETSGIRSLNNVIDITNYVMRVVGHPTHVFDLDRLNAKEITIREAKKGEQIETLDEKIYSLKGGEIVAVNEHGEIVDLLGIMGLSNSVVTDETKRILFFIDNNDPSHMRKTSMELAIRTEAATINEKGISSETAMEACYFGISLFEKYANATNISSITDIYPNKIASASVIVSLAKINKVIGVEVDIKKISNALTTLGFIVKLTNNSIQVQVPSFRSKDIEIEEDIIEEIARIYGYHNLPSIIPPINGTVKPYSVTNQYFWEEKVKQAMKYFGFTEVYTYSFVSESMFEGPQEAAVEIINPLTSDYVFLRNTLIPSLLEVSRNNKQTDELKIFEISNIYLKNKHNLPEEKQLFSGLIKNPKNNFFEVKGLIEQILQDLGINKLIFKPSKKGGVGASVFIKNDYLGEIEILDANLIDFELDFKLILNYATNNKEFKTFAKFPPIVEDITVVVEEKITTDELIKCIKDQNELIFDVSLKDIFENSRTFHIVYQDFEKNLTKEEINKIREKITSSLESEFKAAIK